MAGCRACDFTTYAVHVPQSRLPPEQTSECSNECFGHASAALRLDRYGHLFLQARAWRNDSTTWPGPRASDAKVTRIHPRDGAVLREIRSELHLADLRFCGGRDRHRSGDLALFRRALYQLSYPTANGMRSRRDLNPRPPA
jgi:hypothetical protein